MDLLNEQRQDLLNQLGAIDKALAVLRGAGTTVAGAPPVEPDVPAGHAAAVLPRRVTPRRVLSDAHRQAMLVGGRKAREAKNAAKGLAREMPADSFIPAIGTRGAPQAQAPRLVKRPRKHSVA